LAFGRLRRFEAGLALIVVAAAGIRLAHVLAVAPRTTGLYDAYWFSRVGADVAHGRGFVVPIGSFFSPDFHYAPTAGHPPLYALWLALLFKLGIAGDLTQRAMGTLLGAGTVLLVGLLGRRVRGDRMGLVAASIAALSPLLIAADGALLSETLYGTLSALVLLVAWSFTRRPTLGRAALLGACTALAALTRAEALLLVLVLFIPVALQVGTGRRWLLFGTSVACMAVVLAPWVIRNWNVFGRPLLATDDGTVLVGANNHRAYYGRDIGFWISGLPHPGGNEAQAEDVRRSKALRYARDHAGRVPVVVAARVLREWSFFQPFRLEEQGRSKRVQALGAFYDWLLIVLAVAGAVFLRRLGTPLRVLIAPVWLVTLAAALGYGLVRMREPAELSLSLLAAAGLLGFWDHWRARRRAVAKAAPPG